MSKKDFSRAVNPVRLEAQREYDLAVKAMLDAADGDDEAAYFESVAVLNTARTALIQAEQQFPTRAERRRAAELRRHANRGLDIF